MDPTETQNSDYKRLGPVGTVVSGLILAGVGFILAFVLGQSAMKDGAESDNWPSVMGKVTASKVTSFGSRDDRSYRPEVSYEYSVNGQKYIFNRINFDVGGIQSHIRLEMVEITDRYRPGTQIDVYYKPEDPGVSCLETGMRLGSGFVIGIGCIAFGLLIVISGMIAGLRKWASKVTD
jgi:hypothetical protein